MGFFNKNNIIENRTVTVDNDTSNIFLGSFKLGYSNYKATKNLKLATVFRCSDLISNSIAALEINPYFYKDNWKYINYNSNLFNLLNVQPNAFMSAFTFKKTMVLNVLLSGNAYILIRRNQKGDVIELELLNPDFVKVLKTKTGEIKYQYTDDIKVNTYDKSQIAHILNFSEGGFIGKSTLDYAYDVLSIAYDSETSAKNWFQGVISGILTPKQGVNISADKAKLAKKALTTELSNNSNSIIVLDSGFDFQTISNNPKNSQLLESRAFNIISICSFFGVPPSMAFSQSQSYATAEQEQLSYLNNCINPLIQKIEDELFRKLFLPSEYNTSDLKIDIDNLLRLDADSRSNYYSRLFNIGALTVNEIREKLNLGFPQKNGNRSFIPVNLQALDNLISEQTNTTDPNNQIDNKLK